MEILDLELWIIRWELNNTFLATSINTGQAKKSTIYAYHSIVYMRSITTAIFIN